MSTDAHRPTTKHSSRLAMLVLAVSLALGLIPLLVAFGRSPEQTAPTNFDLAIEKTHVGDLQIGTPAVFTLVVTNVGSDAVTGPVTVSDNLPVGLTPVQVAGSGWSPCSFTAQLVTCVYSNTNGIPSTSVLPPIIIVASVGQAAAPSVTNSAVLSNASDANASNNTRSDTARVVSADLAVTKRVSNALPAEGDTVNFTVRLVNNGPSATTGVLVTDTLPGGVTFIGAVPTRGLYDPATGLWTVGDLLLNEAVTLTLSSVVNQGTRGSLITNVTNGVSSDLFDYNSANNASSASLRVRSTRLIGLVTSQVTNQPVITATVVITDSLNRVYTTATAASGWYTFTDTTATPLTTGVVALRVSKTGYRTATASPNLTANTDTRQDIQLGTTDLPREHGGRQDDRGSWRDIHVHPGGFQYGQHPGLQSVDRGCTAHLPDLRRGYAGDHSHRHHHRNHYVAAGDRPGCPGYFHHRADQPQKRIQAASACGSRLAGQQHFAQEFRLGAHFQPGSRYHQQQR